MDGIGANLNRRNQRGGGLALFGQFFNDAFNKVFFRYSHNEVVEIREEITFCGYLGLAIACPSTPPQKFLIALQLTLRFAICNKEDTTRLFHYPLAMLGHGQWEVK